MSITQRYKTQPVPINHPWDSLFMINLFIRMTFVIKSFLLVVRSGVACYCYLQLKISHYLLSSIKISIILL